MSNAWKELINRYAGDKEVCNCGQAYYKNCGEGYVGGVKRTDLPACEYGCSANQINAKDYIAERVLAEIDQRQA